MGPSSYTGYAICAEMRSGSTLLCQLLASTGKLGAPDEFFRDSEFCVRVEHDPKLLQSLVERGSTDNGIFGIKVFTSQFDYTRSSRWVERLNISRFIHLERRDLLAQAISCVRALQTGQYFASQQPQQEPRYDGQAINTHLLRIAEGHSRWRSYFARNGIKPLWLIYEELVDHPDRAVEAVAAHLGVPDPVRINRAAIDLEVQSDRTTAEWRERFLYEAADLNRLDHSLGDKRIRLRRAARDWWYLRHRLSKLGRP